MNTRTVNGICMSEYSEYETFKTSKPNLKNHTENSTHPQHTKLTNSGYGSFSNHTIDRTTKIEPTSTINFNKRCVVTTAVGTTAAIGIGSIVLPVFAGLGGLLALGASAMVISGVAERKREGK